MRVSYISSFRIVKKSSKRKLFNITGERLFSYFLRIQARAYISTHTRTRAGSLSRWLVSHSLFRTVLARRTTLRGLCGRLRLDKLAFDSTLLSRTPPSIG